MRIGFNAPTAGPLAAPDHLFRIATGGEALGFDYATFSDHVVIPYDIHARYPYSATGEFPNSAGGERHDQLTAVSFVAAKTTRLRLITSVMVVPHRPAVLTAKMLATIDYLSNGRLTVGIGAGWLKEEFEAINAPPFEERGKVTDEYVAAWKELWSQERPKFAGKYSQFDNIAFRPKPVQKPHPPIWVGGESGPAMRRTAALGDAWYPIGTNPANPMDSLKRYKTQCERLQKMAAAAGRKVGLVLRASQFGDKLPATAGDGERRLFSGKPADIAGDLRALREMGVSDVDLGFPGASADEMLGEMQRFRNEVLAKL
jgi:probable F420-dependent oxidoreductase